MNTEVLPGGDVIRDGLRDLELGAASIPALLVSIGAPRLARSGVALPAKPIADPERRLYERLAQDEPDSAHGRYNALVRRLVSFERALECGAR